MKFKAVFLGFVAFWLAVLFACGSCLTCKDRLAAANRACAAQAGVNGGAFVWGFDCSSDLNGCGTVNNRGLCVFGGTTHYPIPEDPGPTADPDGKPHGD